MHDQLIRQSLRELAEVSEREDILRLLDSGNPFDLKKMGPLHYIVDRYTGEIYDFDLKEAHQKYTRNVLEMFIEQNEELKRFRGVDIQITYENINEMRTLVSILNETTEEVCNFYIIRKDGVFSN